MIMAGGKSSKSQQANNVLPFGKDSKGLITIDVRVCPNNDDARKAYVRFDSCRLTPPLVLTGWCRTVYSIYDG